MKHTSTTISFKSLVTLLIVLVSYTATHAQAWNSVGTPGFSSGATAYTSIVIDNSGTPYVFFQDVANAEKATVMTYSGGSWVTVGAAGFSAAGVYDISIAVDATGTPYVAYEDAGHGYRTTVMKFDGTNWVTVGTAGFSAWQAHYTSIAIDASGNPYVAYEDAQYAQKATVMMFNGTSWVNIGTPGFTDGMAKYTSIALDASGTPYVAYEDVAHGYAASVMKFNGISWVVVGSNAFSAGSVQETSLSLDHNGIPYVIYQDGANSNKATVMKFNGTSWSAVGAAGFSTGATDFLSIAIDTNNTPYAVYEDNAAAHKANAMKFDGTNWITAGNAGISSGSAVYNSIAIDHNGIAYVVYDDYDNAQKATVKRLKLPEITGTTTVCVGTSNSLSNAATGGTWTSTNTGVASIDAVTGAVTPASGGNTTISYTVAGISAMATITVNALPAASSIVGATNLCTGANTILTDAAPGGVWMSTNGMATVSGGMVTGVNPGTEIIKYVVSNSCGSDTEAHVINVALHPVAGTITGGSSLCQGAALILANTATGGTWAAANAHATVSGGNVTGLSAGTDVIMYIATNTCGADTVFHTVTVASLPDAGTITGAGILCSGTAVNMNESVYTGTWSSSNTAVATVAGGVVTAIGFGTAQISYTVSNGVCAVSAVKPVTVDPIVMPSTNISAGTADSISYPGQMVTLYASVTYGGADPMYSWYVNGVAVPGANSNSASINMHNNDVIYCVTTSNLACAGSVSDTSNKMVIYGTYAATATNNVEKSSNTFSVYPVPNNGTFTLSGTLAEVTANLSYEVIDMMGQTQYKGTIAQTSGDVKQVIETPSLANGNYILRVSSENETHNLAFTIRK